MEQVARARQHHILSWGDRLGQPIHLAGRGDVILQPGNQQHLVAAQGGGVINRAAGIDITIQLAVKLRARYQSAVV